MTGTDASPDNRIDDKPATLAKLDKPRHVAPPALIDTRRAFGITLA